MDGTYAGTISETLMDEIKLVNKMVKLNDCYATPYTERRTA